MENIKEEYIKKELEKELSKEYIEKELKELIESEEENTDEILKKIISRSKKLKTNLKKNIEDIQKNNLDNNMKDEDLKKLMKKEKKMCLVLDGYRVHKSRIFNRICKTLNIEVIILPPYSPHLNPIEQVWRIIKRYFAYNYTEDFNEIRRLVTEEFYKIVKYSFIADKWLEKFVDDGGEFVKNRQIMFDIINYDVITYFSEYTEIFKKFGVI